MNAPSWDIKDMLEAYQESSASTADDLGLVYKTNLFIAKEPSDPPDCVTIQDTGGRPPYMGLTDVGYEYPSIQIRIRTTKYMEGWDLANRIKDVLHGRANETWNGTLYTLIQCMNGPAHIDWDDNNRAIIILNFNLQRR